MIKKKTTIILLTAISIFTIVQIAYALPTVPASAEWIEVPKPTSTYQDITAMSSLAADDAWALTGQEIMRWDGMEWEIVESFAEWQAHQGIDMVSTNDGWIVLGEDSFHAFDPIPGAIWRWNGISWDVYETYSDSSFQSIDMLSSNYGWAIAYNGQGRALFYQWDGNSWNLEQGTNSPQFWVNDVDTLSTSASWAVGWAPFGGTTPIWHWNGTSWAAQPVPADIELLELTSVSMISETDGWAVGEQGLLLHWNGIQWSKATSPTTEKLESISMVSGTDGWAVAEFLHILHWDGSDWTIVPNPAFPPMFNVVEMLNSKSGWIGGRIFLRYIVTPSLEINFTSGAPGSYFTISGSDYPANDTATISINGQQLGSVGTDGSGSFTFLLSTPNADEGIYMITASVNPRATIQLILDAAEPTHPQEGTGPIIDIPAGIAFTNQIFLPLVQR